MVDAWGLDELQMLLWRCLLHLTGDEDFVFQETQPMGTVPLDWLQGVCVPVRIVIKTIQLWSFGADDSRAQLFSTDHDLMYNKIFFGGVEKHSRWEKSMHKYSCLKEQLKKSSPARHKQQGWGEKVLTASKCVGGKCFASVETIHLK